MRGVLWNEVKRKSVKSDTVGFKKVKSIQKIEYYWKFFNLCRRLTSPKKKFPMSAPRLCGFKVLDFFL